MTDEELREKALVRISEHVAAGKPVILGSFVARPIGHVDRYTYNTSSGQGVVVQRVRIVRRSSHEEYLRVMPPGLDGQTTYAHAFAYYYEVESD